MLPEHLWSKQLHHLHAWPSQGQTQVLQGSLRSKLQWMTHIQRWKENHNLNPRAVWLRKKTPNLPTSSTSCRLNPHDQLGRLCACGIYKRSLRVPTKENTLVLIAVDIGGKNTQDWRQIRAWVAPTAGPEISSVGGHPREVRGTVTPSEGKDSDSSDSRKTFIILIFFDLFYRFFQIFLFPLYCSYWYNWHYEI